METRQPTLEDAIHEWVARLVESKGPKPVSEILQHKGRTTVDRYAKHRKGRLSTQQLSDLVERTEQRPDDVLVELTVILHYLRAGGEPTDLKGKDLRKRGVSGKSSAAPADTGSGKPALPSPRRRRSTDHGTRKGR